MQSEYLGKIISKEISQKVNVNYGAIVGFKKIHIAMFPPSVTFHDFNFNYTHDNKGPSVNVIGKKVAVYLGLINLFSRKMVFEKINISDGLIEAEISDQIDDNQNKIDWKKIKIEQFAKDYIFSTIKGLPIILKKFEVDNTRIKINKQTAWIDSLKIKSAKDFLGIKTVVEEIQAEKYLKNKLNHVDILSVDVALYKNRLIVDHIEIMENYEKYKLSGDLYNFHDQLFFDGSLSVNAEMAHLFDRINIRSEDQINGLVDLTLIFKKDILDPEIGFKMLVKNFFSPWAKLDTIEAEGTKQGDLLQILKLSCGQGNGRMDLVKPFFIFDIKNKKMHDNKIVVRAKNLHTNDALYVIREQLDILKGFMNGNVEVELSRDLKTLSFRPLDDFYVEDLILTGKPHPILQNPKVYLEGGSFDVALNGEGSVEIDTTVKFNNSVLPVKGIINEKINLEVVDGEIDFKQLGPIAGFPLHGSGDVELKIHEPEKDVVFDFDIGLTDVIVDGFNLGTVIGRVSLNMETLKLSINAKNCKFKSVAYQAEGSIDIKNDGFLDLNTNILGGYSSDVYQILSPLTLNLDSKILYSVNFIIGASASIQGRPRAEDLNIKGEISGKSVQFYTEEFDRFSLNLDFKDNTIGIKDFILKKHSAQLEGRFSYDLSNKFIEYDMKLGKLKLKDLNLYNTLNLGYEGKIDGMFYGSGELKDLTTRCSVNLSNAYIGDISVKGSSLNMYSNGKNVFINMEILGDTAKLDAYLNFDETINNKTKLSYLNLDFKTNQIREMAGLISEHNMKDNSLNGVAEIKLRSAFDLNDSNKLNLSLNVVKMNLANAGRVYRILPDKNQIVVNKGKIEKWDLLLAGDHEWFKTQGEGSFSNLITISSGYKIDASILTLLTKKIRKSEGKLEGEIKYKKDLNGNEFYAQSSGKGIFLKIDDVPGVFEKMNYQWELNNDVWDLKTVNGLYGGGNISASGRVLIKTPFPVINIEGRVGETQIAPFSKTTVAGSGKFSFSGERPPYTLESKINLSKVEIFDELEDILRNKNTNSKQYDRFLPAYEKKRNIVLVNYKIYAMILNQILIRNAVSDIKMDGHVNIEGSSDNPDLSGELRVIPINSKLFFKGNEFTIHEGRLLLAGENLERKPEINLIGQAKVNEYDIKMNLNGRVDDININFSSDPALPKEDIISLLAFGFTTETSKNMQQSDRQAMTSVGLGSLLVEQLKINQSLNSSLGLKLSIVQEFQDTESSLVSGTTASGGDHQTTKIRSATRVKLQKQLGKKVDVSVSSSVGGSLGEKQDMNLNYNFNKHFTLQGVYEIKTDPEISSESSTSMGADLKIRISF